MLFSMGEGSQNYAPIDVIEIAFIQAQVKNYAPVDVFATFVV